MSQANFAGKTWDVTYLPEGWEVVFAGQYVVIATHPEHAPRYCYVRELPKPFEQWEKLA